MMNPFLFLFGALKYDGADRNLVYSSHQTKKSA